jgi:hypothetical protein
VRPVSDDEFLKRFEGLALPDGFFRHRDHVRLARLYVSRYPILEALSRLSSGLAAHARSRGRPERYHETITWAHAFLIRERMARAPHGQGWDELAEANADLLDWKESVLRHYYRADTLRSDLARSVFLLPDKLHMPAAVE